MDKASLTVTIKGAEQISGLSKATLYRGLSEGKITGVKIGKRRLIHLASLKKWLDLPEQQSAA